MIEGLNIIYADEISNPSESSPPPLPRLLPGSLLTTRVSSRPPSNDQVLFFSFSFIFISFSLY